MDVDSGISYNPRANMKREIKDYLKETREHIKKLEPLKDAFATGKVKGFEEILKKIKYEHVCRDSLLSMKIVYEKLCNDEEKVYREFRNDLEMTKGELEPSEINEISAPVKYYNGHVSAINWVLEKFF